MIYLSRIVCNNYGSFQRRHFVMQETVRTFNIDFMYFNSKVHIFLIKKNMGDKNLCDKDL